MSDIIYNYELKDLYSICDNYDFSIVDFASKDSIVKRLVCYIKNISFNKYYLIKNEIVFSQKEYNLFNEYINKIVIEKIPIEYITNLVSFYNEEYYVDENVLIPRQDTELLVEKAIEYINCNYMADIEGDIEILDMCSGSGAIGISICKNIKESLLNKTNIAFCDISKEALSVCKKNSKLNELKNKSTYITSNLFESITNGSKYDIIVSNPPYITEEEMKDLSDYVKKEPTLALYGGKTGVDFYERIIKDGLSYLKNDGCLLLEIGYKQRKSVCDILLKYKEYTNVSCIKDINSKDRVIICRFHKI